MKRGKNAIVNGKACECIEVVPHEQNDSGGGSGLLFRRGHILDTMIPKESSDDIDRKDWHNCDHVSGGGGN